MLNHLKALERLAAAGRYADLVTYVSGHPDCFAALDYSPAVALMAGTALARLGRPARGEALISEALAMSRQRGDRAIEVRALNALGAVALEGGRLGPAAGYFEEALAGAAALGDDVTAGHAANNLGILQSIGGDPQSAIASHTRALATFGHAGFSAGIIEAHHNLAIAQRESGRLDDALASADRAVDLAHAIDDRNLVAQSLAGRAEIRVACGDAAMARREAETAMHTHHQLSDDVGVSEDLRVIALARAAAGEHQVAVTMLRDAAAQGQSHGRPLLTATANRDLAHVLGESGQVDEARRCAAVARAQFVALGALGELRKLDGWMERLAAR